MNPRHFPGKRARVIYRARSERHARKALAHLAREAGAQPVYVGGRLVRHVLPDGWAVCEKRRYSSEAAALAELQGVRAFAHLHPGRKLPVRAYACEHCHGWHVTSKPHS